MRLKTAAGRLISNWCIEKKLNFNRFEVEEEILDIPVNF